jgi:hypothetical protein
MVTASGMGIWTDEAWVSGHCARCPLIGRILLANLLQGSRSTFYRGSFPSFFAFKEGMLDTQISDLGVGQQYPGVL